MQLAPLSIAAIFLVCGAAMAQSPFQLTQSNLLKVESLTLDGTKQTFIFARTDIHLRYSIGDGVKIGGDLGVDSLQVDAQRGGTVFATGVVDSPFGKLSIGIPRLVMPQFFDVPAFGGSEVLGVIQGLATGEVLRFMTYFSQTPTLRGVRYDAQFGKVRLAAALQELGTKERLIHAFAVTYDLGAYSLSYGRSDIDLGPSVAKTQKIGVRGHKGRLSGGAIASKLEAVGAWETTLNGFVGYAVTDRLSVEAQVFDIKTARESYVVWGADAVYWHDSGVFVQAGVAQLNPSGERIFNLSLGYQF